MILPLDLAAFGGSPVVAELAESPQFSGGVFRNVDIGERRPASGDLRRSAWEMLTGDVRPRRPIALVTPSLADTQELAVTWFGHSSTLVQIDGVRVLIDPVWCLRASPSAVLGPRRLHAPPCRLEAVMPDVVVISHDHYDHLDMAVMRLLAASSQARFVVPLGVGAHLRRWGVPADRVTELDWHASVSVSGLRLTAAPAQHFSGRSFRRNTTLWCSWVIAGSRERVFYTGDTGYGSHFTAIGQAHGPFDVTLVQVGAYSDAWPDMHMTPEEGVQAHRDLGGGLMIGVHWGTFVLAPHPWAEPAQRLTAEAARVGVDVALPRPGQTVRAAAAGSLGDWWSELA